MWHQVSLRASSGKNQEAVRMCYESFKVVHNIADIVRIASQLIGFVFQLKHAVKTA